MSLALAVAVWAVSIAVMVIAPLAAQQPSPSQPANQIPQPGQTSNDEGRTVISDAERIAALQQLIETDTARLAELQAEVETIGPLFESGSATFNDYDTQLNTTRKRLEEATRANDEVAAERLNESIPVLEQQWEAAREQFNLVIQRRKAIEQQLQILPEKLQLERQALESLTSAVPASERSFFGQPGAQPLETPRHDTTAEPSAAPGEPVQPGEEPAGSLSYDPRVAEARAAVTASERELRLVEQRLKWINRGTEVFASDLRNTEELLVAAQSRLDTDRQSYEKARQDVAQLRDSRASRSRVAAAGRDADAAEQRLQHSREEVERYAERVKPLRIQMDQLKEAKEQALLALRDTEIAVTQAGDRLRFVESPFSPHRIFRWLQDKGLKVLIVTLFMFGFWAIARLLGSRIVKTLALRGRQGSQQEREERAETLRRVFQSVMGIVILTLGSLAVLEQMGIDVTLLLGGAAVFGMAIAFAAQTLLSDYFHGFMILMESQYQVGNVIRIGSTAGVVEDITLRVTVLRDLEGVAHFIPHSQVAKVSNLTYGWSRVVFEIGVAYKEDVDRVIEVLTRLAADLRQDSEYKHLIVDDAEMLGVDAFGDSAVVIKFMIKTKPLKQWPVKRELLRRIKNEFDALGIEIPFPHQTIFHRNFEDKLRVAVENRQAPEPVPSVAGGNDDPR